MKKTTKQRNLLLKKLDLQKNCLLQLIPVFKIEAKMALAACVIHRFLRSRFIYSQNRLQARVLVALLSIVLLCATATHANDPDI